MRMLPCGSACCTSPSARTATSPMRRSSAPSIPTSPMTWATWYPASLSMIEKYFGGTIPSGREAEPVDQELIALINGVRDEYEKEMDTFALQNGLAPSSRYWAAPTSISTKPLRGFWARTRARRTVWPRCSLTSPKRSVYRQSCSPPSCLPLLRRCWLPWAVRTASAAGTMPTYCPH